MWKYLHDSVTGLSHQTAGTPCQDRCNVKLLDVGEKTFLIFACADGAGSAEHSQVGAESAVSTVITSLEKFMAEGGDICSVTEHHVLGWFQDVHDTIASLAAEKDSTTRDFACTLLAGIVGDHQAVFAQIGDGAIVVNDADKHKAIFWPQSGEYHNTTYFITDPEFSKHHQWKRIDEPVKEIAVFTDGLQMLALNYGDQSAHSPFFRPMFASLQAATDANELAVPFREFLGSPSINERTDDDKSLILAVRINDLAPDT